MAEQWVVHQQIPMRDERGALARSVWLYSPLDPWAVTLDFSGVCFCGLCEPQRWSFARELLHVAPHSVVGAMDVQVHHLGRNMALRLSSPDGVAILKARSSDVKRFLRTTEAWVPPGEEAAYGDLDAVVARILEEADRC